MNELAEQLSTKIDAGFAVFLIVMTGVICFYLGLFAPFVVIRIAKILRIEFGEFFEKEDDEDK